MLLELFAFFGLLAIIMFAFAEWGSHQVIGILASLFIIVLGSWIFVDGFSYQTASVMNATENHLTTTSTGGHILNGSLNGKNNYAGGNLDTYNVNYQENTTDNETLTLSRTETTTIVYSPVVWSFETIIKFQNLVGLLLSFSGLYGIFTYVLRLDIKSGGRRA